ncbi:hypothetical protein X772_33610 [Mesorhizobium sp. LSJC280B00]|nr:hypothetical protein X772_33610 [Mesorhizobium sp. LSJC280B00]
MLYHQTEHKPYVMKPVRTDFERALIEKALSRRMPILGVCNGMQLLAICLGGQLVQDIPTEVEGAFKHRPEHSATIAQHQTEIIARSRHLVCPEETKYAVNSVHHQAVLPAEAYKPQRSKTSARWSRGPRGVLFLVARIVAKYDPHPAAFKQRLQASEKEQMVIRIALARKLLVTLNAKARDAQRVRKCNLTPQSPF